MDSRQFVVSGREVGDHNVELVEAGGAQAGKHRADGYAIQLDLHGVT
jgi:hypothetical protein